VSGARSAAASGTLAVLAGACCIAAAPIMVKLSPLGPQASAFWRLVLALPLLAVWAHLESRQSARTDAPGPKSGGANAKSGSWGLMLLAGVLFAGDLATWHAGIVRTTAANATFLANLTPVVVIAATWLVTRRTPRSSLLLAVAVALAGALLLSGGAPGHDPERLLGDLLSALTALWYGAYMLVIARIRTRVATGQTMLVTTAVAAVLCLLVALVAGETVLPTAGTPLLALWPLLVLGWLVHVGGQGLLAYGLGRVSTPVASVLILLQPVGAACLGWLILHEVLEPVQLLGGALVLLGVWLARREPAGPAPIVTPAPPSRTPEPGAKVRSD
jgi:drug/metabolite transporter (DMT)-like permease